MIFIDSDNNSTKQADWLPLLELISEIKGTYKFGKMMPPEHDENGFISLPCMMPAPIVDQFLHLIAEQKLILSFNWPEWQEGKDYLMDSDTNYADLEIETLRKLLTLIIRTERFNEGYLVSKFEDGTILDILEAIKHKYRK